MCIRDRVTSETDRTEEESITRKYQDTKHRDIYMLVGLFRSVIYHVECSDVL